MSFAYRKPLGCLMLVVGLGVVACGDKTATPDPAASASAATPATAIKRPDPLVTKTFKAESCYYGALSLRLARAAYTQSLAGAEPDATHIPDFGAEVPDAPPSKEVPPTPASAAASAAPAGSAKPAATPPKAATAPKPAATAPKPAATAAAKPVAATSASPTLPGATPKGSAAPATSAGARPMPDPAMMARIRSVPYERFVRSCHVAAGIKDPAAPELDAALKSFAEYALPLAKSISEANAYYQKEEWKTDDFKKGKEYHTKITEAFAKLDDQVKGVEDALAKFKTSMPVNSAEFSESQKLAEAVVQVAAEGVMKLTASPIDPAALAAEATKIEAAVAPLKKIGEDNKEARDPWAMLVVPPAENFAAHLKALSEQQAADITVGKLVNGLTLFSRVHEGNNRALSRKLSEGAGRGMPNNRMLRPKLPAGIREQNTNVAKPMKTAEPE